MMGSYKALIDVDRWEIIWLEDRQGNRYRIEGFERDELEKQRCPVEKCKAACCRRDSLEGVKGAGPCRFLDLNTNLCIIHSRSVALKPLSCFIWPKHFFDPAQFPECPLRLVKIDELYS